MTETVKSTGSSQQKNTLWRWLLFLGALVGITVLLLDTPVTLRGLIVAGLGLPVLALIGQGVRQRQPGAWVRKRQPGARVRMIPWLHTRAATLSQWTMVIALVCMVLAAIQLRPGTEPHHVLWLIPGVLLLILATELRASTQQSQVILSPMKRTVSAPIRWPWLIFSTLALFMALQANLIDKLLPLDAYAQGGMILAGTIGIALAFREKRIRRQAIRANWHWVALVGILLLAAVLRLWNLEWWTTRWLDEMIYADATINLRTPADVMILTQFNGVTAFAWVYPLLQMPLTIMLGPGLLPLRLLSAFVGLLTVAATSAPQRVTSAA